MDVIQAAMYLMAGCAVGMFAGHAIGFGKGRRERDNDQSGDA